MRIDKPPVKTRVLLNVSIQCEVLDATRDFLSALIVEFIYYRFTKNNKKPVWLKIDWFKEKVPHISRSGLAKKLNKLERDEHIIVKRGEGRHYHKCWYSPSPDMREACDRKGIGAKVYYNLEIANQHPEASVIYAAIVNLLKIREHIDTRGSTIDKIFLDYGKLVDGSGLSLARVRKAVRWLIENEKIESKKVFGNKLLVWLPAEIIVKPADLKSYLSDQLPTECYPHGDPEEDLPAECYPHAE